LTPAYEHPFSQTQMVELLSNVSQVIPPLSVWQSGQLCVALPFLSVALAQGTGMLPEQTDENNVFDSLQSMAPYLTDCALNSDFDARARSAAASSLYHIITKFQKPDASDCLSKIALSDNVMPSIIGAAENLKAAPPRERAMIDLCEALDVAALLVRAVHLNNKLLSFFAGYSRLHNLGNRCCMPRQVLVQDRR
jgi:hypothetical protein